MKLSIILIIVITLCACNGSSPSPQPRPTIAPTSQPTPQPTSTPTSNQPQPLPTRPPVPPPPPIPTPFPERDQVNIYKVDDLGQAINDAQKPGFREVVVNESGELKTPVVLHPGWRLRLTEGVMITTRVTFAKDNQPPIPFRLRENASIIGPSMESAGIMESSVRGQWTVIGAYNNTRLNGTADEGILLQGFAIHGSPERQNDFNSTFQAISLGNCKNCNVHQVWVNGTHAIGLQLGGAGWLRRQDGVVERNAAEDSSVTHCRFTRVASQALALVNGRRINFSYNQFEANGQEGGPGATCIDIEPNTPLDAAKDVTIKANWLDFRKASQNGNGILAQSTVDGQDMGGILIENNVILGGNPFPPITNWCSNGIYVFGQTMKDVIVRNNHVTRTGQSCIRVEGLSITVTDNKCHETGSAGVSGFVGFVINSRISGNTFSCNVGPCDGTMEATGTGNVIENNPGWSLRK